MGTAAEKSPKNESSVGMNGTDLRMESQESTKSGMCNNCGVEARARRRTFSEQAWTVLLLWNEISPAAVDQPICEDCYQEMREILIDRTDEIEAAMQQSDEVAKIKQKLNHKAS